MHNFNTLHKEKSLIVDLGTTDKLGHTKLIDFVKSHGKNIDSFTLNPNITKNMWQ
jgi:hypothetical protein